MGMHTAAKIGILLASVTLAACGGTGQSATPPISDDPVVLEGFELVRSNGCVACHSVGGSPRSGPSLVGLSGSTVTLEDGSKVTVDSAYLREALTDPAAAVRSGYSPDAMERVRDSKELSDKQIDAMVAYIEQLR